MAISTCWYWFKHYESQNKLCNYPQEKCFLNLSKLKNEKRCSQRRQAIRTQGWDELFGMPGAWMGTPKVSRRRNTVLCDYTVLKSTLSLHCFKLISIWITGHMAEALLWSLSFVIHLFIITTLSCSLLFYRLISIPSYTFGKQPYVEVHGKCTKQKFSVVSS